MSEEVYVCNLENNIAIVNLSFSFAFIPNTYKKVVSEIAAKILKS